MKRLKRIGGLGLLLVVALLTMLFGSAIPAFALTTADVAVNATPSYVAITCNFTALGYSFGAVAASSNTSTPLGQFGIDNTSTVQTDQTISVTGATWLGGVAWTHDDTGNNGADTVALFASDGDGAFDVIVENLTPGYIAENQALNTDYVFELRLFAPTTFSDGVLKTNTVRITAAAG